MRYLKTILLCLASTTTILSASLFADFEDRIISAIRFEGLDRVTEQRVENLIQSTVGELYVAEIVEGDIHTLTHLGEFKFIQADVVLQEDGTVELIYTCLLYTSDAADE